MPHVDDRRGGQRRVCAELFADPEIGLFEETLGAGTSAGVGEDTSLFYRILKAGHRIVYEPSAYVWHRHRRDLAALRRQLWGYSAGHVAYHMTTPPDWTWGLWRIGVELPRGYLGRLRSSLRGRSAYLAWLVLYEAGALAHRALGLAPVQASCATPGTQRPHATDPAVGPRRTLARPAMEQVKDQEANIGVAPPAPAGPASPTATTWSHISWLGSSGLRYRQAALGWIWAIAQPLARFVVLAFLFTRWCGSTSPLSGVPLQRPAFLELVLLRSLLRDAGAPSSAATCSSRPGVSG